MPIYVIGAVYHDFKFSVPRFTSPVELSVIKIKKLESYYMKSLLE